MSSVFKFLFILFILFGFPVLSSENKISSKIPVKLDKRFIPINKEIILSQKMTIIDGNKNSEIIILDNFDGLNIVNFWASWCGPCIAEISELNKEDIESGHVTLNQNRPRHVQFLMIDFQGGTFEAALRMRLANERREQKAQMDPYVILSHDYDKYRKDVLSTKRTPPLSNEAVADGLVQGVSATTRHGFA